MSLADLRDIVVIIYGVLGILLFVILIVVALLLYSVIRSLTRTVQQLIEEPVRPTLEEVRETARNARGASEFWADHAVSPVIKTVAAARGVRKGLSTARSLMQRGKR